jgi:hypothetical protein
MRDYTQAKLKRSLKRDSTYCMRLYVNLPDSMTHSSRGQLGIYLSNTAVSSTSNFNLPYTPQLIVSPTNYITDKLNWTEFNLQYTAAGGERYITIGNFNDTLGIDTLFSPGGGKDLNYYGTYYFIDNLYLGHCDSINISVGLPEYASSKKEILIYPNPARDIINLEYQVLDNEVVTFELIDVLGKVQLSTRLDQINFHSIKLNDMQQGVYFYRLISNSTHTQSGKLIIE